MVGISSEMRRFEVAIRPNGKGNGLRIPKSDDNQFRYLGWRVGRYKATAEADYRHKLKACNPDC